MRIMPMGRVQGPSRFNPRRAAVFWGQQKRQRMTESGTASSLGRQMQPPHRHHGGGRRQVSDHCGCPTIAQGLLHRPKHVIAFVRCHEKHIPGVDQIGHPVRA
jgi:hypothetical protein